VTGDENVSINGVHYGISDWGVEEVVLAGGDGDDRFEVSALRTARVVLDAGSGSQDTVEIDVAGQSLQRLDHRIQVDGRAEIEVFNAERVRALYARSWHNVLNPEDVNNDFAVVPQDVLVVINELNVSGFRSLRDPPLLSQLPALHFDTNNDGELTPFDALVIINRINSEAGERESPLAAALPAGSMLASPQDLIGRIPAVANLAAASPSVPPAPSLPATPTTTAPAVRRDQFSPEGQEETLFEWPDAISLELLTILAESRQN
jgi:hypothetical protein